MDEGMYFAYRQIKPSNIGKTDDLKGPYRIIWLRPILRASFHGFFKPLEVQN